ncbi:DUF2262 domain-containing protein [Dokdonia sp. 4H-3-7-5]|uniref:DUF2262 domain-containing protein n=1 Tax=Dokdonia sp. (strain 4H-3-7-5) TaxID=983548 RepID=UPI00020A6B84|nr:DUF2262 domain-containing protein [Dokdonia sp. 4H-3-7-5]AEE18503.1 hypothetical protein Krodi_0518 [Dokdonia sp. 4H-3-7-5]
MRLFSRFKNKGNFKLSIEDFTTEKDEYEVESVSFSGDFFDKFPQVDKEESRLRKAVLITKTAIVAIFGKDVEIRFDPTEITISEEKFVNQINSKLQWIAQNEHKINSRIAKKLLDLKNDSWLEENQAKLTKEQFITAITLKSISFFEDISCELIFDDGDLFWQHEIIANLSSKNKLTDASIRG